MRITPDFPRWYNPAVISKTTSSQWQTFLADHPNAHILQTPAWGDLKAAFGWSVTHLISGNSGAQILFRHLPLGFSMAYIPKGPIGDWSAKLVQDLDKVCQDHRAFALKVELDLPAGDKGVEKLSALGFVPSPQSIQPRSTLVVDLELDEEQILMNMHQKTRYNVRLAGRKQVQVRPWTDLDSFSRMIQKTGARGEFGVHTPTYYRLAYDLFHPAGVCELFVAEYQGEPLAALMVFAYGSRAWYFYGASTEKERNRMPTYLLQWKAMQWARQRGCTQYDLWGVPDADLETLEANFTKRSDGLWGVYRFKRGFGGELIRAAGALDRPYNKPLYALYRLFMKKRRD